MIADDLFAGAGGWDVAAAQLGITARGVENMREARATRDAAGLHTIHDDVWTFRPDGRAEGLIASPPCQTFSQAGKGAGRKALDDVLYAIESGAWRSKARLRDLAETTDPRTALVLTPLHFAMSGGYRWAAFEQVPTVLPVWEACAEVLRRYGADVWTGYLFSEQYGVPQTRKRAFLLASLDGNVEQPTPTHSRYYARTPDKLDPGFKKWVSMAEGLGWELLGRPSYTITGGSGHAAASGIEWGGKSVRETGGAEPIAKLDRYVGRADWMPRGYMSGAGSSSTIQRPRSVDEPAHTITGKGTAEWHDRPEKAPGHDQRARDAIRLEPFEAGILQSFPADYPWQGAKGKQYLQCGNAVPPGMALHALAAAAGIDLAEGEAVA